MTPEEQFLKFAHQHSKEYMKGWIDGLFICVSVFQSLYEKAESRDSTSGDY